MQKVVFFFAELVLIGAPQVFPQIPPMIGAIMFWGGVIGLVISIGFVLLGSRDWIANLPWRRLKMTQAARLLYADAQQDLRTTMATAPSVESWCRSAILIAARDGKVRLFARRGEGLPQEVIPISRLQSYWSWKGNDLVLPGART